MKTACYVSGLVPVGLAAGLVLSALLIFAGCDVEPAQDFAVSVSPQTAQLSQGQSQLFTASGGIRYSWSISSTNDPWGFLSASTGDQVTYTSLRSPTGDEYVVQTLTISATMGSPTSAASATAYIYHVR